MARFRKLTTLEKIQARALIAAAIVSFAVAAAGLYFDGGLVPWWLLLIVFLITFAGVHKAETKSARDRTIIKMGEKL